MRFEFGATIDQRVCRVRAAREQFLPDETVCDRPHKHFAMEFHCVFRGKEIIDLPDEERRIPLSEGQILLIPADLYHGVGTEGKTVDRICFHFTTEEKSGEEKGLSALGKRLSTPLLFEDAYAKDLMELCRREQLLPASPERNARLGLLMISTALRLLSLVPSEREKAHAADPCDRKWVILEYVERHFTDPDGLAGLAKALYLSRRQTASLVKKYLGVDFKTAVRARRMELADIFLRRGDLSLEEIAWQVGYRSYSGFQLSFKAHFGTTPSARRRDLLARSGEAK